MAQIINTNIMSLNAQRNLNTSGSSLATSIQRLSSGLRINSAKDDAAGLAISERFTTQIRGMDQAARNANDGISLSQTAEGALGEISNNLQRIRELAVQSRNATNSPSDRAALDAEVQLLKSEIQRVAEQTNFNGTPLLDGSFQNQAFQVGADQGQVINIAQIANANIKELGNWNRVDTPATASSVAADGGYVAGTPTPGTSTLSLAGVANPAGALSFQVGSTNITVAADPARTTAADLATAVQAAIGTNVGGLTATVNGTNIGLSNTNAAAIAVSGGLTGNVGPQTEVGGTPATFSAGNFTLTGPKGEATINFSAAGGGAQRASDLVKAVNNQSYNTGVTASLDAAGNLMLSSASGQFTVAGDTSLTAQTGLTADTTTNWVAGAAETGFADLDVLSATGADNALNAIDSALQSINSSRADLGAVQNRFTSTIANLNTSSENLSAARSRIRDTDYAKETAELTRTQILQQAGTAMLAQANQSPQNVLSLLK